MTDVTPAEALVHRLANRRSAVREITNLLEIIQSGARPCLLRESRWFWSLRYRRNSREVRVSGEIYAAFRDYLREHRIQLWAEIAELERRLASMEELR